MRRINLKNYTEKVRDTDGNEIEALYDVRNEMIEALLSRGLGLSAREALDREDLARRIRDSSDGSIMIEEGDYTKLVAAVDTIKGWCRTDIKFLHRIFDAPKVEVEESKPKEV